MNLNFEQTESAPLRVAYVSADPGVPVFGCKGCSIHVQAILRELVRAGCTVDLFARRTGGDPTPDLASVRVHPLPAVSTRVTAQREQALAGGNRQLRLLMERHGPYDLVYERYALWSYAATDYAADCQTPSILEINAPLVQEQQAHRNLANPRRARELSGQAFAAAAVLLAVSEAVAEHVQDEHNPRDGQLHVVPNGVDPELFVSARRQIAARTSSTAAAAPFTVGFVGTLRPWHGLETLAAAFGRLHAARPQARLLVVGDGSARAQLEAALPPATRPAVTITGAVAHADVPRWMSAMDVGVAPYPAEQHFYFSPLKIMEYMAAGLPIVCSTAGATSSLLNDQTALFFAAGDAHDLAKRLIQLHDDPSLRQRLGQAAAAALEPQHTWAGVLQTVFDLTGVRHSHLLSARSAG